MRPLTSAVEPRGGFPGVLGGKLWFSELAAAGTRGEKVCMLGREYSAEERKRFRGVEVTPEKLVDLGTTLLDGACDMTDADMAGGRLFGLSPGIRLTTMLDGRWAISDAEMLWDSLLDGPWGRPMILRDAICDSLARFIGLCGADVLLLNSRCAVAGAAGLGDASVFMSRSSAGTEGLRKSPVKPKMLRFLDGGSMMSLLGRS